MKSKNRQRKDLRKIVLGAIFSGKSRRILPSPPAHCSPVNVGGFFPFAAKRKRARARAGCIDYVIDVVPLSFFLSLFCLLRERKNGYLCKRKSNVTVQSPRDSIETIRASPLYFHGLHTQMFDDRINRSRFEVG